MSKSGKEAPNQVSGYRESYETKSLCNLAIMFRRAVGKGLRLIDNQLHFVLVLGVMLCSNDAVELRFFFFFVSG